MPDAFSRGAWQTEVDQFDAVTINACYNLTGSLLSYTLSSLFYTSLRRRKLNFSLDI